MKFSILILLFILSISFLVGVKTPSQLYENERMNQIMWGILTFLFLFYLGSCYIFFAQYHKEIGQKTQYLISLFGIALSIIISLFIYVESEIKNEYFLVIYVFVIILTLILCYLFVKLEKKYEN